MPGPARWMLVAGILLALAPTSPADEIELFNGKDLEGWVAEGVSEIREGEKVRPVWTAREGLIHCEGKGFGFLRYGRRKFDDFTFHVEFKMAPKCNSGIGVRTTVFDPAKSRATRPSFYSYEIQLQDDSSAPPTTHSSGSLYRYVAPSESALKPAGEWNTIDVTCEGPNIKVVLNGKKIIDVDQSKNPMLANKPLEGYVCVQNHGGTIDFRALRVRELGK